MLESYLNRSLEDVRKWEASVFDSMAEPFQASLVLYGAGKLGRMACSRLRQHGIEPLAFSDQEPRLWGSRVDGLEVLSPKEAASRYGKRAAFVVTVWNFRHAYSPTQKLLAGLGCERVIPCPALFYKYPADFLPYFSMDLPSRILLDRDRVKAAFDLMADDESREEFIRELSWRMDLDLSSSPLMEMADHHFPSDLVQFKGEDVLIDCGAYDGDTVLQFLQLSQNRFRRIVAFEPDPYSFEKLKECVGSLPKETQEKIEIRRLATGARHETLRFNAEGLASSGFDPEGAIEVESVPLDDLLGTVKPTYIKMDIEGAEMDALRGGSRLIREALPVLAICVYHCPDHLWEIPLTIQEFSSGYKLYLRRYAEIPWEVVCYGIA